MSAPPIDRRRLSALRPPAWPIAPDSTARRDEARESARRSRRAHWPTSMARDGPPTSLVAHSTTAETPWQRRESRGPEAAKGRPRVIGHRQPPVSRRRPRVLTCTPMSSASTGNGRSAWSSRCVASARARASIFSGVARRPASHGRYDSGDAPIIAANAACDWPARSGIHAPYGAPRRHTMPSAQAVAKRWGGARRTSVSQSWKVTGHFFRLYLRPRCPGRGHNRRILLESGAPGRARTCDPRLRRPMLYPTELLARAV